ncbi:M56 family metallopeptidase [Tahibacter harae]|uniref:M56 family metallopeptidase n=1 Tax=Tahibacter harae TaxID=2963937 RepID=A0ABT1QXF2_9GAMM|nr:M56 family metallopeptidase [Tahibacter harae]MCQ4166959.1 M56 family metallopeptidase [Tahibacter harae]
MTNSAWLQALSGANLAVSVAALAVLLLRRPLRRAGGALAAYRAWWTVPAALLAALLPLMRLSRPLSVAVVPGVAGAGDLLAASGRAVALLPASPLGALWLAGALGFLLLSALHQRRFRRGLRLRPWRGPVLRGEGGPCLLGLLRPRVVLPADFRRRYEARERRLILAHEIVHLRRGDLFANAAALLLRGLFWFNPLLHFAATRLRQDQELACDAAVAARFPQARRCYAGAMLKAQLGEAAPRQGQGALGCGWRSVHPLKQRIHMLNNQSIGKYRRRLGAAGAALLALLTAAVVWAAQPPAAAGFVDAQIVLRAPGKDARPVRLVNRFGERFAVASDTGVPRWQAEFVATPVSADTIRLVATLQRDGRAVAHPEIWLRDGEAGSLRFDSANPAEAIELELLVRRSDGPPLGRTAAP